MNDDEAWEFLRGGHTAVLTTLRRDGWPVTLPLWYVVGDRTVYVATPARTRKVARVRSDDRGSLLVEQGEAWVDLAAVQLPVRATILEPGAEVDEALAAFDAKYARRRPAQTALPDATREHYTGWRVIRLDPAGPLLTWDNSKINLG